MSLIIRKAVLKFELGALSSPGSLMLVLRNVLQYLIIAIRLSSLWASLCSTFTKLEILSMAVYHRRLIANNFEASK